MAEGVSKEVLNTTVFLWWRTSSFCIFSGTVNHSSISEFKTTLSSRKYYCKTAQNHLLWVLVLFVTLLTHRYLGYSQVGNIKYQITKRVIVISMTNFLPIILNLITYRSIAQYHTNSHFDKCIKNPINFQLNRICHFFCFTLDGSFVHSVVEITDHCNHGSLSLSCSCRVGLGS